MRELCTERTSLTPRGIKGLCMQAACACTCRLTHTVKELLKGTTHAHVQIDMIEEVLAWSGVQGVTSMVDVGCGIGGSSRHILNKYPGMCARARASNSACAQVLLEPGTVKCARLFLPWCVCSGAGKQQCPGSAATFSTSTLVRVCVCVCV